MDAFRTWQRQFLSKKGNPNRGFLSKGKPGSRRVLSEPKTTDQLFHCHSPDLAIGGFSSQDFLYPILDQGRHPVCDCQTEHVSSPGS